MRRVPIILDFVGVWSNPLSPVGPCCATKKDMAPENPDTTTVSGFFRAPIFKCKQKDIFLCSEDFNYRPPLFQAAFERYMNLPYDDREKFFRSVCDMSWSGLEKRGAKGKDL